MGLLSKKIKASKKRTVKGAFNIKAMDLILASAEGVDRDTLLELNITMRLNAKFDFDFEGYLSDEIEVDELSVEHLDEYNQVSAYIDEVYKTSSDQVGAYITNTSNHRSFNGWAKKNNLPYYMTWNVGKTVIEILPIGADGECGVDPNKSEVEVEI